MALFSAPIVVESEVPRDVVLDRLRHIAESRLLVDTTWFRLRNIIGWSFQETDGRFTLRPSTWTSYRSPGPALVGTVEPTPSGSRIAGRVVTPALVRIGMSVWLVIVAAAPILILTRGDPSAPMHERVRQALVAIPLAVGMFAVGIGLVQHSLRSTRRMIVDALQLLAARADGVRA